MPLSYQVVYELRGTVLDANTGYEKEVLIDLSTNQSAMQTELNTLQTSGLLADGTVVKNLIIRAHPLYAALQEVP